MKPCSTCERVLPDADFYRWLKRNDYPRDRFRLLCWNCNCALGIHGRCHDN